TQFLSVLGRFTPVDESCTLGRGVQLGQRDNTGFSFQYRVRVFSFVRHRIEGCAQVSMPTNEAPSIDEARGELTAILQSPGFAGSKQRSRFLSYIVERTLEGRANELKELTIALEVFGRPPSFDQRL